MRYQQIDPSLFIENRKKLKAELPDGAVAIFHSNDVMPTNADAGHPFIQNSDLFWLTGIDQEETVFIMFPEAPDSSQTEILFVKKTNEQIAIWEGHKYTKEEATATSGITNVQWTDSFEGTLKKLLSETDLVYIPTPNHAKLNIEVPDQNVRFGLWCREKFPMHRYRNAATLVHKVRLHKSRVEIDLIKQACDITEKGFRRILDFVKPGVWEFEIEAEFAHEFIRNRARGFAYEPIIASGGNSCVLHYIANDQKCKDGDILLFDVGSCYANYASDMSRTIPVNGRFSERQLQVYQAVLRSLQQAKQLMVKGTRLDDYNRQVALIVEEELVGLGLLSMKDIRDQNPANPAYMKYFMHKTAHSLGLDVHDVGDRYATFQPGMVFTCEPGIYIREEALGIRLENDILITDSGNEDLMATIPIEPEEIESLMNA